MRLDYINKMHGDMIMLLIDIILIAYRWQQYAPLSFYMLS